MSETIFMIHGMWGGSWYWQNYKHYLEAKGYRCVVTTLRHHDVSPKDAPHPHLGTTSLLDYVDDLEQEIRALGVKPIIMGHSMGGLLAQMLAARGLAKAVVLLAPASPAGILALTEKVTCPILVLAGKEDRITPLFVQRKIADKYKELATYREFSDHAHWLMAEKGWEGIVGYADDWMRNLKV